MFVTMVFVSVLAAPLPVYGADATTVAALRERLDVSRYAPELAVAAVDEPPAGAAELKAGVAAYEGLLFEEAVPRLEAATQQLGRRRLSPAEWKLYYDAVLYLALVYDALGRTEDADRLLDGLAVLTADAAVADERFAPPFRERVAKRLAARPVKSGAIRVESQPPGAAVFVNGRRAGVTPLVVRGLAEGEHTVTVSLAAHGDETRRVPVRAGFGIGAEATPEFVAATLRKSNDAAVVAAFEALRRGKEPAGAAPETAAVVFVDDGKSLRAGAYVPGRGWTGTATYQTGALGVAPLRDQIVRQVAGWFAERKEVARAPAAEVRAAPTRWWLWTGLGAVVAGGATAAVLAAQAEPEPGRREGGVVIGW